MVCESGENKGKTAGVCCTAGRQRGQQVGNAGATTGENRVSNWEQDRSEKVKENCSLAVRGADAGKSAEMGAGTLILRITESQRGKA